MALAQVLTLIATFFFTVAQARYLSPATFGKLSVALSANAILMLVVDFGLGTKLPRDVAQRPESAGRALGAALVLRVSLWCLTLPIVWLATVALDYDAELRTVVLILALSGLVGGIAATLVSYFQGREKFLFPSFASVAQRGAAAVLGVGALVTGNGVLAVAGVYVTAGLLELVVLLFGMRSHPVAVARPAPSAVVAMARGTAILGFFWMLGAFYYNVDMLILQRLVPAENVAWYAAAYRLFGVALAVVSMASSMVLYPIISRLSLGPRDELRLAIERSFSFLAAAGVFAALAIAFSADEIIALVFPAREYAGAANALRLLAPAIAAIYSNGPFFMLLLGMKYERRLLVMAAVLAVLNPIANLVLIPLFQQNAAAALTSATEFVVIGWLVALTPRELRGAVSPRALARLAVAAATAAGCLYVLRDLSMFIAVPLAFAAYVVVALGVGVIPLSELRAFVRTREAVRSPSRAEPLALAVGRDTDG